MMKRLVLMLLSGACLTLPAPLAAQVPRTVTGKVTNEQSQPVQGVQVVVRGTTTGTVTNAQGDYSVRADAGQVLQYRLLGYAPEERTVGATNVINVQLRKVAMTLDAVVVTSLGETTLKRSLGTAQQMVQGEEIAATKRENFINALSGRVAGVEVTSSSGTPGASTSITIRGVSSISSSNQPLMIVDGLPVDNKTLNTGVLASDAPGNQAAFSNRSVDFTNRAADISPDDIESLVVLKGPEASALYGIDAANGAIVITTKRGRAGGGLEYSATFRSEMMREVPEVQTTYGPTNVTGSTLETFQYFGDPYAPGTVFYDNIDGFFETPISQQHNLAFSGAGADNRINYRLAFSGAFQQGVVPNTKYNRINVFGSSQGQVSTWLRADLSMTYSNADNDQTYKGNNGPLIGLLVWPVTDNAEDYLTPAGTRRKVTGLASTTEVDNPYFNVNKNKLGSTNSRFLTNLGLVITPWSWGNLKTNIGVDAFANENSILRHPESAYGAQWNGVLDEANDVTTNINAQTLLNFNQRNLTENITINGLVGNQISDFKSNTTALAGQNFLDPNFASMNNTTLRSNRTTLSQRRLVSVFGSATVAYKDYLFVTGTARNDWTSTIPEERNSFLYPSVSASFIFSDAFKSLQGVMTGKLRAAYAEVGKDARPYAYRPSLEYKTTAYGGYGYGFWGPNLQLKPEFARSYEFGTELAFFDNRLGLDLTVYRKQTKDQIVNDIRGSYATGFVLFNLNGAVTRNEGLEVVLRGTPITRNNFTWDVMANFERARGRTLELPNSLPESYVSDTWLYGNVRNGTQPGLSTRSLTGFFWLRNNQGELLIDPTTGLPIRSTNFIDRGYDRQPQFLLGLTNTFTYNRFSLNFLLDIRKGGDVLNATEHYLTARGLSKRTLDREEPRVVKGVLRDGKENSATPTPNNIVVIPSVQPGYYTLMSEELFIEQDVDWVRLRDITLSYTLPPRFLKARSASVFLTATDLFIFTDYSGLDPIVNGNTAAVGGSGAAGIDYGNFPMPRGVNFGFKVGY